MAYDVFISHSSKDKVTADAVCARLEAGGIRCWVAPRDIRPGDDWGEAIINAIRECRVMVLIFSENANQSQQIKREVNRAVDRGIPIIPFRIENVMPTGAMEYSISTAHWLDAFTPPLESHIAFLAQSVQTLLRDPNAPPETLAQAGPGHPPAKAAPEPSTPKPVSSLPPQPPPTRKRPAGIMILVGAVVLFLMLAGLSYHFYAGSAGTAPQVQNGPGPTDSTNVPSAQPPAVADTSTPATPPAKPGAPLPEPPNAPGIPAVYTNSLGVKFVHAGTDGVLFSIWDARVKDYAIFAKETNRAWTKPDYDQTENDPAVNVSFNDAHAFCDWLTQKEQAQGKLTSGQYYRLPTDVEWSKAAGLVEDYDRSPANKLAKAPGWPWGMTYPGPTNSANFGDDETHDAYSNTSPVGTFPPNKYGLYDMGGNVWQVCEDSWDGTATDDTKVLRGSCFIWGGELYTRLSFRDTHMPADFDSRSGFRVVLASKR